MQQLEFNFVIGQQHEDGSISAVSFMNREVLHGNIQHAQNALGYAKQHGSNDGGEYKIYKVIEVVE